MKTFYSHLDQDGMARLFIGTFGMQQVMNPEMADVIIFNGGEDIGTSIYGELPVHRGIPAQQSNRDKTEISIFNKYAGHPTKLLLGVCRGGQLLNCLNGGSLYQDVNGHGVSHPMYDVRTGEILHITSTHHQQFIPNLDKGEVIGVSSCSTAKQNEAGLSHYEKAKDLKDGRDVEIVWYPETHTLCIQGHPEYVPDSRFADYTLELLNQFYPHKNRQAA